VAGEICPAVRHVLLLYIKVCLAYAGNCEIFSSNHIPWLIIGICYVSSATLMLIIRFILARENKLRDAESKDDTYDDVYLKVITEDGKCVERRISKVRALLVQWSLP
jgi:hypothetical protein